MWKTILAVLEIYTLISVWASGVVGAATMYFLGPWLAMLGQMYVGNTEPTLPKLAYPWALTVATSLVPLPFAYKKRWTLATIAAIPFVLAPWWQLWKLFVAAGG